MNIFWVMAELNEVRHTFIVVVYGYFGFEVWEDPFLMPHAHRGLVLLQTTQVSGGFCKDGIE